MTKAMITTEINFETWQVGDMGALADTLAKFLLSLSQTWTKSCKFEICLTWQVGGTGALAGTTSAQNVISTGGSTLTIYMIRSLQSI